jgi:hypothetical protein
MLGFRANRKEPSPLEGSGAFRALQAETELRQVGKQEWWLWFWGCAVTLLSATAVTLSFLPWLFRHTNDFYEIRPDQTQWGTAGLLLVFNAWASYRQWSFRRARKRCSEQLNPFPERNAGDISDPSGFDPLTGLYTRNSIEQQLGKEIGRAKRQNTALSLATLHLEEFAKLSQQYGKSAVDAVLKEFARRMKKAIRGSDGMHLGGSKADPEPHRPNGNCVRGREDCRALRNRLGGLPARRGALRFAQARHAHSASLRRRRERQLVHVAGQLNRASLLSEPVAFHTLPAYHLRQIPPKRLQLLPFRGFYAANGKAAGFPPRRRAANLLRLFQRA